MLEMSLKKSPLCINFFWHSASVVKVFIHWCPGIQVTPGFYPQVSRYSRQVSVHPSICVLRCPKWLWIVSSRCLLRLQLCPLRLSTKNLLLLIVDNLFSWLLIDCRKPSGKKRPSDFTVLFILSKFNEMRPKTKWGQQKLWNFQDFFMTKNHSRLAVGLPRKLQLRDII